MYWCGLCLWPCYIYHLPDPELCCGFIYICHSMCTWPPLHWMECLRSSPGHLTWVRSTQPLAQGPSSRQVTPAIELGATCIDEGLPLPAMKLGMACLCCHTSVSYYGGLCPPAIELRVAWPPTSAWLCSGGFFQDCVPLLDVLVHLAVWVELPWGITERRSGGWQIFISMTKLYKLKEISDTFLALADLYPFSIGIIPWDLYSCSVKVQWCFLLQILVVHLSILLINILPYSCAPLCAVMSFRRTEFSGLSCPVGPATPNKVNSWETIVGKVSCNDVIRHLFECRWWGWVLLCYTL